MTDPNQLLDEIFAALRPVYDELADSRGNVLESGWKIIGVDTAKAQISEHFISREEVKAAIGEDEEPFEDYGLENGNLSSTDWMNEQMAQRNQLRAEIRKELGL